jgi:hypothetical protein
VGSQASRKDRDRKTIWRPQTSTGIVRHSMSLHRFKVGQTVMSPTPLLPPGPYVVTQLLPLVGRDPHYRVKSIVDGHERALLESQMKAAVVKPVNEDARSVTKSRASPARRR